jgi:pimeloyl-ACP methyl ester carboxylesterase
MEIKLKSVTISNGETIGYRVSGEGEKNILLIHGNMTSSKHWDVLMSNFPDGYRIYAIDLRGFGTSSYNSRINSIKDFSEDVRLFTDCLNLKDFSLVGWSLGGAIAMQFAADYPDSVNKLILLESVGIKGYPLMKKDEEYKPVWGQFLKTREEIAYDLRLIQNAYDFGSTEFLKGLWNSLIYTHNQPSPDKYLEYLEDMMTQRNLADAYYALAYFNISNQNNGIVDGTREVDKIIAPTLIIHGDRDLVIPVDTAEDTAASIGDNAKLVVLKNTGHSPLIDCLDKLISIISDFID